MPSHVRYKVYTGRIVIITKIGAIPVVYDSSCRYFTSVSPSGLGNICVDLIVGNIKTTYSSITEALQRAGNECMAKISVNGIHHF